MLKRKITDELLKWRKRTKRKSLVITGVRQCGKTTAVREFGKTYKSYIEINFLENASFKNIFSGDLSAENIITNIQLYVNDAVFTPDNTLILLDEIQECPEAITSLKFFTEYKKVDVIGTGSILGMKVKKGNSIPVGYVDYLDMYSMDFEEFLWANHVQEDVISKVRECYEKKLPVPQPVHLKMQEYLRLYMIIGGLPEVVKSYVDEHDFQEVDRLQRDLYRSYTDDIAKYAEDPDVKVRAQKCWLSISRQLSKENHKFQYKVVEHGGRANRFETSIEWLKNAFMIVQVESLKQFDFPMESYSDSDNFRIYPFDISMLITTYDFAIKKVILEDKSLEEEPGDLILHSSKGALYEALAADMLQKNGYRQLYFYKAEKGTSEVEFVVMTEDGITPVEIKAGRAKADSLSYILEKNPMIKCGYKMSGQNTGVNGRKVTMPLYMLMFVKPDIM